MLATAQKEAQEMRGEGDALAAKVYADSYGQDPEFFSFYRSLEAYEKSFSRVSSIFSAYSISKFM